MGQWRKVRRVRNYDSYPTIDEPRVGAEMQPGLYDIQFPDGDVQRREIFIHKNTYIYNDHGHSHEGKDYVAYIKFKIHGFEVEVKAEGLLVRKVEDAQPESRLSTMR